MILIALAQVDIGSRLNSPITSVGQLISIVLPNLYILAGVILLLLLIAGGFGIIMNAGKGKSEEVAKNSKLVSAAVIGFLIIIGSYWLIQIISTVTGLNILNPPL